MVHLASFWKPEVCGQTVLPDGSLLIVQELVENAKIQKFKCDILSNFQTMWKQWWIWNFNYWRSPILTMSFLKFYNKQLSFFKRKSFQEFKRGNDDAHLHQNKIFNAFHALMTELDCHFWNWVFLRGLH